MSNILLTGGTGFVGSHVARALVTNKHKVILLIRKTSSLSRITDIKEKVILYPYESLEDLKTLFQGYKINHVIHLATKYIKNHSDVKEIEDMIYSNITFPSFLVDLAVKHQVSSFINTGTFFEYDQQVKLVSENSLLLPYNFYASCKIAFEEILKYFAANSSLRALTLKLFSPYGEQDNEKVIPLIIKSFIHNTPLELTKGEQTLSFTYVKDIAEAYIKALQFIDNGYQRYEVFNIGDNHGHTIKDIVKFLAKIRGIKSKYIMIGAKQYSKNEIMEMVCDNSKAEKLLGWKPKIQLTDGLRKTYMYYLQNHI